MSYLKIKALNLQMVALLKDIERLSIDHYGTTYIDVWDMSKKLSDHEKALNESEAFLSHFDVTLLDSKIAILDLTVGVHNALVEDNTKTIRSLVLMGKVYMMKLPYVGPKKCENIVNSMKRFSLYFKY